MNVISPYKRIHCVVMVLSLLTFSANAQIIDNRLGNALQEEMFFNQEFLWLNKIKTVTVTHSVKRPGRAIEQKPDLLVYRFNDVGLLAQIDKVTSVLNLVDSLTIEYRRNDVGSVEMKTENSKRGFYSTKFVYDQEGHLIREDYGKAENISTLKGKLEPGQSITINSETYTWTKVGDKAWKKSNYNNYGLLYSNWMITKNEMGYIESEEEELVMSGKTTKRTYTYNERGWVKTIETKDNLGGTVKRSEFTYDDLGNLLKIDHFEDNKHIDEVEVLYTETMLIEAVLRQDMQTHDIQIQKFSYEFR